MNHSSHILSKILFLFLPIFLVGCTCLPFSSPSGKTPVIGALSYSNITTYIETDTYGNPEWDGWNGIGDSHSTLSYSISPASENIEIDKSTGEIMVLANELFSNTYTVTVSGYGDYQESVTTTLTIEVIPPFLHNVENVNNKVLDNGTHSLAATKLGENTYVFAGGVGNGMAVFSMKSNGSLVNVDTVNDTDSLKISQPYSIATAEVGGVTYMFVVGYKDSGVSVFSAGDDGTLVNVDNVVDNDDLKLKGAISATTAEVEGTTYLFVAGYWDHGLSVFSVGDNGTLVNVNNVVDNDDLKLSKANSVTTAMVQNTTYLFVTGFEDHGLSVFSVGGDGTLVNITNVTDNDKLKLLRAGAVTTVYIGETTYLLAGGIQDSGFSVFLVGGDGSLVNVTNVSDNDKLNLGGIRSITSAELGGTTYLFAAGSDDRGVSAFSMESDGSLLNVNNMIYGNAMVKMTYRLTTAKVKGESYLITAGLADAFKNKISVFSINPQSLVKMKKYRCSIQGVC